MASCAGILFLCDNRVLILQRDKDGSWDLPGGHLDEEENSEQAARRETLEEAGINYTGKLKQISRTVDEYVDYTTFLAEVDSPFNPTLNNEHTGYMWATLGELPDNVHPYLAELLNSMGIEKKNDAQMVGEVDNITELDIAKKIRDGELTSPQKFGNVWLFALRISGTGVSFRGQDNEFVYRNPELYVSEEFLQRCNGLPVVLEHPPQKMLNSEEFAERILGTILLPYVNKAENAPWGIAKIYDDAAAQMMVENKLSTSPGVVWKNKMSNDTMQLDDGSVMLIEGKPSLLDHLAIVPHGVWDKGGEPSGVQVEMTETVRADSADPSGSLKGEIMAEAKHEPQVEHPASTPPAAAKDAAAKDESAMTMEAAIHLINQLKERLDKLEAGEEKEETKMPGIHDNMPAETLPAPGQPAPTAADGAEDIKARIDALEKAMPQPVSDEESDKLAEHQAKADSVYQAFGKSAPRPLAGEKARAYRIRMLNEFKQHSPDYKEVDLSLIADKNAFKIAEKAIYKHAMDAANSPATVPAGFLREVKKDYGTGRTVTEFVGDIGVTFADWKAPKRLLVGINK